ncbi:MAG: ferritin-like domain-containing protein [Fibrobacter sp.]|nr:ferritin-like domain-containing protein [Fibrobacter sp.]
MEQKELVKKLETLQKTDYDALQSYDKALERIDDDELKNQILQFRKDHERHIYSISDLLRTMGLTPSSSFPDLKGVFLQGITAIEGLSGTEGVLKALEKGEIMTNDEYAEADTWFVDPKIHEIITSNYKDEKKHLNFIRNAIKDKIWEKRDH